MCDDLCISVSIAFRTSLPLPIFSWTVLSQGDLFMVLAFFGIEMCPVDFQNMVCQHENLFPEELQPNAFHLLLCANVRFLIRSFQSRPCFICTIKNNVPSNSLRAAMPSTNTWTNPCWRTLEAKSMALWFHWSIQYTIYIYIYVYIHINIYYKYHIYIYMYVVDDNKWSFYDILKKTHRMDICSMTNCPMSSRAPPHIPPKKPPRCPSTLKWPTILRFAWQPDAWWLPHILKPLGNSYSKCGYLRVDICGYIMIDIFLRDWSANFNSFFVF